MVLKNFSMIQALRFGFDAVIRNFLLFAQIAVVYLAYFALLAFVIYMLGGSLDLNLSFNEMFQATAKSYIKNLYTPIGGLLYVINLLAGWYLAAGLTHIALKIVQEKTVSISDLFISIDRVWKYWLTGISFMLLTTLGYFLLIIPGYYFTFKYLFAPIASIDFNAGVKKSFEISRNITFGAKLKLFFTNIFIILCLIAMVALLSVLIIKIFGAPIAAGIIVLLALYTAMAYALSLVHIYKQLLSQEPS